MMRKRRVQLKLQKFGDSFYHLRDDFIGASDSAEAFQGIQSLPLPLFRVRDAAVFREGDHISQIRPCPHASVDALVGQPATDNEVADTEAAEHIVQVSGDENVARRLWQHDLILLWFDLVYHLGIPASFWNYEARDLVVQGVVSAVESLALDVGVDDLL